MILAGEDHRHGAELGAMELSHTMDAPHGCGMGQSQVQWDGAPHGCSVGQTPCMVGTVK